MSSINHAHPLQSKQLFVRWDVGIKFTANLCPSGTQLTDEREVGSTGRILQAISALAKMPRRKRWPYLYAWRMIHHIAWLEGSVVDGESCVEKHTFMGI